MPTITAAAEQLAPHIPARVLKPVPTDWERYLAEARRQLDEMHAKLAIAERQLPVSRDVGTRLVREQWDAAARRVHALSTAASAPPAVPALDTLGRERGLVHVDGETIELSPRHTELLVLLASRPVGMTTEELAIALYGDFGRPASVRTELCRIRKRLGRWIHGDRNRLTAEIDTDFQAVERLLRDGRWRAAAQRYRAPLLPGSDAPGVIELRNELDACLRWAVITSEDREALWAWVQSGSGADDLLAWKRVLTALDPADPRRSFAVTRIARLRAS